MTITKKNKKKITDVERKILEHVSQGAQNRKIASQMYLSQDTVKAHISLLLKKLGAENRTHAIYLAMKHKIID